MLPNYFDGIRKLHEVSNLHMRSVHSNTEKLTEEASDIMRKRLKNEFELYEFVKARLIKQHKKC